VSARVNRMEPAAFRRKFDNASRIELGRKRARERKARAKATSATAAIITINKPAQMTLRGRRAIARWMRSRADDLETEGDKLGAKFVARFCYSKRA
jgi:hypothetical protein